VSESQVRGLGVSELQIRGLRESNRTRSSNLESLLQEIVLRSRVMSSKPLGIDKLIDTINEVIFLDHLRAPLID
jgi:hypothetical protein